MLEIHYIYFSLHFDDGLFRMHYLWYDINLNHFGLHISRKMAHSHSLACCLFTFLLWQFYSVVRLFFNEQRFTLLCFHPFIRLSGCSKKRKMTLKQTTMFSWWISSKTFPFHFAYLPIKNLLCMCFFRLHGILAMLSSSLSTPIVSVGRKKLLQTARLYS